MRLLDLCCRAGGASVGYHRAGFTEVVGWDLEPITDYPYELIVGDITTITPDYLDGFDLVHVSPPCQSQTALTKGTNKGREYPNLIPFARDLVTAWVDPQSSRTCRAPSSAETSPSAANSSASTSSDTVTSSSTGGPEPTSPYTNRTVVASLDTATEPGTTAPTSPSMATGAARAPCSSGNTRWASAGQPTGRTSLKLFRRRTPSTSVASL